MAKAKSKSKQITETYKVVIQTGEDNSVNVTPKGLTLTVNPGKQSAFNMLSPNIRAMIAAGLVPQHPRIAVALGDFFAEITQEDRFWSPSGAWLGLPLHRETPVDLGETMTLEDIAALRRALEVDREKAFAAAGIEEQAVLRRMGFDIVDFGGFGGRS